MATQDILLIHGTWANGTYWDAFAAELRAQGYTVHAPTLPHHGKAREMDVAASAREVTKLGLPENVAFLREIVDTMATPPIIVGHSLGCLYAQLLAAQVRTRGVVLIGTAPAAGVFAQYPTTTALWARYLPQFLAGSAMRPVSQQAWNKYICNTVPRELADAWYQDLCPESGRVYRQMVFFFLDPKRRARVDFAAVDAPVLVIAGGQDKCCVPAMNRATARRYGHRGTYVEIPGSDHMMTAGPVMPTTLAHIYRWIEDNDIGSGLTRR